MPWPYSYNTDLDTCDALDFGDTETDQFIYTLFDGFTTDEAQLSINISGRNDVPFFNQKGIAATITEQPDSTETITSALTGNVNASDPDTDAVLTYSIETSNNFKCQARSTTKNNTTNLQDTTTIEGCYGSLSLNTSTGDYIYTPESTTIEPLNDGETVIDFFRINVTDSTESTASDFTVTITGADDNPAPSPTPDPSPSPQTSPNPQPSPTPTPQLQDLDGDGVIKSSQRRMEEPLMPTLMASPMPNNRMSLDFG